MKSLASQIKSPSLSRCPCQPEQGYVVRAHARHSRSGGSRSRTPWTDEEVEQLTAAVNEFGKGKWARALKEFKFKDCRTAVDLKDKWRNLQKD